ncbi:MAG: DUF3316 domain-containing protein [Bacteroidales bacterium]
MFIILLLLSVTGINAADDNDVRSFPLVSSLYFTVGGAQLKDTYLSIIPYRGVDVGVGFERFRTSRFGEHKWNTRHLLEFQYANAHNGPRNTNVMSAMLNYEFSFYRRFEYPCGIQLFAGGNFTIDAGSVCDLNNGNNPAAVKTSVNLGITGALLYKLHIKGYPINMRYSLSVPTIGMFFCPQFGESYYELFYLGNRQNWLHFGSFANQLFITNLVTLDFPIKRRSLRIGYEGKFRSVHKNYQVYQYYSNSFIIGVTIESVVMGAERRSKSKNAAVAQITALNY